MLQLREITVGPLLAATLPGELLGDVQPLHKAQQLIGAGPLRIGANPGPQCGQEHLAGAGAIRSQAQILHDQRRAVRSLPHPVGIAPVERMAVHRDRRDAVPPDRVLQCRGQRALQVQFARVAQRELENDGR